MSQAAHGLADDAVARPLAIRAVLSEPADAHHDDARVDLAELRVTKPPLLEPPWPEILDDDVALAHQIARDLLALGGAQIDTDQRLVAQQARGVKRFALETLAHRAQGIALESLDLDDIGAKVRQ